MYLILMKLLKCDIFNAFHCKFDKIKLTLINLLKHVWLCLLRYYIVYSKEKKGLSLNLFLQFVLNYSLYNLARLDNKKNYFFFNLI